MQMMTEPTLADLRAELARLTRERTQLIESAKRTIEEANRDYDERALELHRQIRRLEPSPEPLPITTREKPRRRSRTIVDVAGMEEWSEEERRHYLELLNK